MRLQVLCIFACLATVLLAESQSSLNMHAEALHSDDAEKGKAVFEKRCTGCHALANNREGPRLQGVYGRPSGTVPGFAYSEALKNAHIVWDEKSLEKWLTDPDRLVPGNNMGFSVSNPVERHDLIEFLRAEPVVSR